MKSKAIRRTTTLLSLLLWALTVSADTGSKMVVHFFGSKTCGECLTIRKELLEPLEDRHPGRLDVRVHNIDEEKGFQMLLRMEDEYGVTQSSAQELFLPDTFLTGADDILKYGRGLIEQRLKNPRLWKQKEIAVDTTDYRQSLRNKFREYSFVSILLAGLADGVNPCAIATMIFLISFLATQKRKRSEILVIGLSFTAAVFTTYLLMGLGAFKALTFLGKYLWISRAIKWIAVAFAGVVGLLCFRDAIVYKRTGKAQDIKLQLPKSVKMSIHRVITRRLSRSGLVVGAVITGFLVTLLEAVCTGQVYLPTIVLMTRESGLQLTGWLYLLFYNFLFVLPLLIVMILACCGLTWQKLAGKTQENLTLLKVLLGIVLVSLAVFLGLAI